MCKVWVHSVNLLWSVEPSVDLLRMETLWSTWHFLKNKANQYNNNITHFLPPRSSPQEGLYYVEVIFKGCVINNLTEVEKENYTFKVTVKYRSDDKGFKVSESNFIVSHGIC